MYASSYDFVCIALLLPFFPGFCLSIFCFLGFFSIVFSTCYHWWICFFGLLALFFLSLLLLLNFFNNYFLF